MKRHAEPPEPRRGAVFDPTDFQIVRRLESGFESIRKEYCNLDAPLLSIHRNADIEVIAQKIKEGGNGWTPSWQIGSTDPNHSWLTYGLSYKGFSPPEVTASLPNTMALLRHAAFEVCAFSVLRPLSCIGPHAHSKLGGDKLTLHVGLDVEPGRSFLSVNGSFLEERNGKAIVFDGSYEHFAINMSLRDRAILYIEFDRSKL